MRVQGVAGDVAHTMYLGLSQALDMMHAALDSALEDEASIDLMEQAVQTLAAYRVFYELHQIPASAPH